MSTTMPTINAMTVDVEDYFQVSAFEGIIDRSLWDNIPCRVEGNTDRILNLFAEKEIKATFFTLGWVAERYPDLVKRIVSEGHELASHGFAHTRVTQQSPKEFRADIEKTKQLLEDISGNEVRGYRAPSYSIGETNLWALDELCEAGYRYSSSIYPVKHDLYGRKHHASLFDHEVNRAFWRSPLRLFVLAIKIYRVEVAVFSDSILMLCLVGLYVDSIKRRVGRVCFIFILGRLILISPDNPALV